jgi:glycosyltransferase involved in cell wall biosynthesis
MDDVGGSALSRVLVVTDCPFWHEDRGDRARIASLCRHLINEGHPLHVFVVGVLDAEEKAALAATFPSLHVYARYRSAAQPALHTAQQFRATLKETLPPGLVHAIQAVEGILGAAVGNLRRIFTFGARRFRSEAVTMEQAVSPSEVERFAKVFRDVQPDALIIEYVHLSGLLDGLTPGERERVLKIIDTLDVMHVRAQGFRLHRQRHWLRINREEEQAALRRFDAIVAIQGRDAEVFREMLPQKDVLVVRHAPPLHPLPLPQGGPVRVLCVATAAPPNVHGMRLFLRQVWRPLHERMRGRVELVLAGQICERLQGTLEGVIRLGHVADLTQVYSSAHIVVNPVQFGGGLKIKCVEGLSHGRPVVTTVVGAEGLEEAQGKGLFICRSPGEMQETLVRLVEDAHLRREAAAAAFRYAQAAFSAQVVYAPLERYILDATLPGK